MAYLGELDDKIHIWNGMKFIIALVLAIPTYGMSLIILIAYLFIKHLNFSKNMEKAIVYLSSDSYPLGTCFDEIRYAQALAYADEVGNIISKRGQYVEFEVKINGDSYFVTLNREPDRNGAILTSKIT
ncbi:MAG: hypothetical protein HOD92_22250 [Deltaproteobacteria bacterium]|jgi:hypothetical protein|nr:hypothetical protein [Deltaproteobacteria bacterium]MBT4527988.1 hypothetical protein [Deltaproteobacteria bacterium]